jgi:hypothetical protein
MSTSRDDINLFSKLAPMALLLPTMSLTDFPQDILLEVAKQVDAADLISFLSVHRTLSQ